MAPIGGRQGFTLIELLTVIAIVALLAGLLFPLFARAKKRAEGTVDVANMHQIFTGLILYEGDNGEKDPLFLTELHGYLQSSQVLASPLDTLRQPEPDNTWTNTPLVPCVGRLTPVKVSYPYLRSFLEPNRIKEADWQRYRGDSKVGILASTWLGDPSKYPGPGGWCGQSIMDVTGPVIRGPIQRINMDGSLYILPQGGEGLFGGGSLSDLFLTRL